MMKACPLEMLSRCMAGNWWEPVVSVIWSVQMEFLLHVITWTPPLELQDKKEKKMNEKRDSYMDAYTYKWD